MLAALAMLFAALVMACATETCLDQPDQSSEPAGQGAESAATTGPTEAPEMAATPAEPPSNAVTPANQLALTAVAEPQPEPTATPTAAGRGVSRYGDPRSVVS